MKINILVGARFQAKLLANFFQKNYIDCTIYTSSPPKNWQEASLSGTKIIRFIPLFFKIIFKILKLRPSRKFREFDAILFDRLSSFFMRESDVLHGWATFSLYSAKKYKKKGKYFVLERACPHVLYQEELLSQEAEILSTVYDKTSQDFVSRAIEEYTLADKIIVPSMYSYDSFIERGVPEKKLEIVRLDANFFPKNIDSKMQKKANFVVGTIGGNVLRKGFLYLVDAWQSLELKDAKLLLKTSVKELKNVPKIWDKIKDDDSIEIVGYFKNIEDFYKQCDVFCLSSIDDGFGMVVFEALACAKPVIATKNVGASEMLLEGKTGFILENRDTVAIARSIKIFYDDRGLIKTMGANALEYYKQYQQGDNNYESQMMKIYKGIENELKNR